MKKRGDGRYCKQILVGYQPDGKRIVKTIYGTTIREVEKKERELRNQIDNGTLCVNDDEILLKVWAMEWIKTYKLNNVEDSTYLMYLNAITTYIILELGEIPIKNLKTIQVQQFLNSIISQGKIRTAQICKLTLGQMMKQALYNRIVIFDVMAGLQSIKKEKNEKRPLTDFEKLVLENSDLSPKQRTFLDIMRYMGLRRGEALALTKEDIDFNSMRLTVHKSLAFVDNDFKVKSTKTISSNRVVPIPQFFADDLDKYLKTLSGNKLFTAKSGDYMTKSAFRKFWEGLLKSVNQTAEEIKSKNKIYENCNIGFTPHIFRHTYATDIYYSGIDVKTAQYLLGHSSVNITLDIYTHLDKIKIGESVNKFEKYISQSKISQTDKKSDLERFVKIS